MRNKNFYREDVFKKPTFKSLIQTKKDGLEYTEKEIRYIVDSILLKKIPDFQLSALIMCIYFNGMSIQETETLVREIILSGEIIDLSSIEIPKISYASIGVKNDQITNLVLPALLASCDVLSSSIYKNHHKDFNEKFLKINHIPKIKTIFSKRNFIKQLELSHCILSRQIKGIAPVSFIIDKIRKKIGNITNLQLITSSILGRKFSEGMEGLVVDIKIGNGSTIQKLEKARKLSRFLIKVSKNINKRCVALITNMNQPIGNSIGINLELKETIKILSGYGSKNLKELIIKIGMEAVRIAGVAGSTLSAKQIIQNSISSGKALKTFINMIKFQEGDTEWISNTKKIPSSKKTFILTSTKRGYIYTVDVKKILKGWKILSNSKNNKVDPTSGLSKIKKVGTQIKQGEPLAIIHYNNSIQLEKSLNYFLKSFRVAPKKPSFSPLIIERIA
jgi:pyrimidine-nucleoside phosphorylase